ncbi:hypothetical protein TNCV_3489001 [Trichonephila clavipes]|nr:hypothetical protein TNCV_3489001 [Trichonephila clavipes]
MFYRPIGNFTELNRTVTCMVLTAKVNDRRTSSPLHDEFHGPRSDYVRQDISASTRWVSSGNRTGPPEIPAMSPRIFKNPNKTFNNCVWSKVPKNTFVDKKINTYDAFRKIDKVRICKAEMMVQKASKKAKTIERPNKRKKDALEVFMQDEYKSGMF